MITSVSIKILVAAFNLLEVPLKSSHNISMKKIINEEGFKKAMSEGKTWTTLDCQLSETEKGRWYFEIDKHVFTGAVENIHGIADEPDASMERLANGDDDDSLKLVGKIWDNLIEKYSPDEYFVDQEEYKEIDYQALSDKLDKEASNI